MTIEKIDVNGTLHEIHAARAEEAGIAGSASSADTADIANTASYATEAGEANHADTAGALSPAAKIELTGAVTGSSTNGNGWTVNTSLAANSVTGTHIADSSIGLNKLADEIGVVVVQSAEPATDSAAKIWIKI